METPPPQTALDGFLGGCEVENPCGHHHHSGGNGPLHVTELPVLGLPVLDQVFFSGGSQECLRVPPVCRPDMERMSPDSSMDWAARTVSTAMASPVSSTSGASTASSSQQPDSTTGEQASAAATAVAPTPSTAAAVEYDSDAFNSDDSNESFVELQLNPSLLTDLANPGKAPSSDPLSFAGKLPPSPAASTASDASSGEPAKDATSRKSAKAKKKSKRAGDVPLQCQLCPYTTRYKEHLTSHMNTHREDRAYMCSDCGQTFKWSHSLKRHQRKHRMELPHRCPLCPKAFPRKDHLDNHFRNIHEADRADRREFRCPECGDSFKNKKTLAGHAKTHGDRRKAHKCPQCPSEFTRRASLNRQDRKSVV